MKNALYILLSLFLFLFVSCKKDNESIVLLKKAQEAMSNDPAKAQTLLESIHTPQDMGDDYYMQYIIDRVRVKSKLSQSITGDTLIFEAEKYFEDKDNNEQAALAHIYAGIVSQELKRNNKSLISFLKSAKYAIKAKDNKLSGRAFEYIGYTYFEQNLKDSAIVNYQKAINYYNIEKDALGVLRATNEVGRAYEYIAKLDSAYAYFDNALQMAEKLNDEWYKSNATQNLAVVCFGMGDYDKAVGYYKSALDMQATIDTQKRQIYLYLLRIYTIKQDANTGKEYALKVEASLPEVTFIHTREEMYTALSSYYKLTGDYKQALHFKELESDTKDRISKEERPAAMVQADKDFRIEQADKKYTSTLSDFYFLITFIVLAVIVALAFALWAWRDNKKDKEEIRLEREKYDRMREHMREIDSQYPDGQAELDAILKEIEDENKKNSEGEL